MLEGPSGRGNKEANMTEEEALNPPINQSLSHLSLEQINEMLELYYADTKIPELLSYYKINASEYGFYNLFPPEVISNERCKYCDLPMWRDRKSKSAFTENQPYCPVCNHKNTSSCNCTNCSNEREVARKKEVKRIISILQKSIDLDLYEPIDYYELSDLQKIYLGSVLRVGLSENITHIKAFSSFDEKLTPTTNFDKEVLDELSHNGILKIHPESTIDCFADVTDDGHYKYYPTKVLWHVNVEFEESTELLYDKLINFEETIEDTSFLKTMWLKISLNECLEYLSYQLQLVDLDYNTGDKTNIVFYDLLKSFSVGQIYGIIWSSVTGAVRFYQEKHVPKESAAKSVITNCQRYGEKALLEKWNVKTFSRIKELPQTGISKYFFNRILKIGDDGFNTVIYI